MFSLTEDPALFCGDTLFNAGAGNCTHGGNPVELYETFAHQLAQLPEDTRIFPGHDYIANNLAFTLDREPGNNEAKQLLAQVKNQDPHHALITTLAEERKINSFFRLNSPGIIAGLQEKVPDFPRNPSEKDVFIALRELRNHW
jgi:hydroxyacylglutathione hydrolase